MKTKLLKKLRKEADNYYEVLRIALDPGQLRNVGIVVWGEPYLPLCWISCKEADNLTCRENEEKVAIRIYSVLRSYKREYMLRRITSLKRDREKKLLEEKCDSIVYRLNNKKISMI